MFVKKDSYQEMWEKLRDHLSAMDNEGKEVSSFGILCYMDVAEENLRKKLAQRNYDSFGISYAMGQVRYASSVDTDSPYTLSDWGNLYRSLSNAAEKGGTQIKWNKEAQKWIVRKIWKTETRVLKEVFIESKCQEMLCYMADNDLF